MTTGQAQHSFPETSLTGSICCGRMTLWARRRIPKGVSNHALHRFTARRWAPATGAPAQTKLTNHTQKANSPCFQRTSSHAASPNPCNLVLGLKQQGRPLLMFKMHTRRRARKTKQRIKRPSPETRSRTLPGQKLARACDLPKLVSCNCPNSLPNPQGKHLMVQRQAAAHRRQGVDPSEWELLGLRRRRLMGQPMAHQRLQRRQGRATAERQLRAAQGRDPRESARKVCKSWSQLSMDKYRRTLSLILMPCFFRVPLRVLLLSLQHCKRFNTIRSWSLGNTFRHGSWRLVRQIESVHSPALQTLARVRNVTPPQRNQATP